MDVCEILCVDSKKIKLMKDNLINEETLEFMSDIFRAMSDPLRLSILTLLNIDELCVCEIMELLDQKQSTISHHLRILRNLRIVKHRKEGKNVFYSLQDDHIKELLKINKEHVEEER